VEGAISTGFAWQRDAVRDEFGPIPAGPSTAIKARMRSIGEDIREMVKRRSDAHRHYEGKNDFFYPQRLLIALLISLFALALSGILTTYLSLQLAYFVDAVRYSYLSSSLSSVVAVDDGYASSLDAISVKKGGMELTALNLSTPDVTEDLRSASAAFYLHDSYGLPTIILPILHLLRYDGSTGAVDLSTALRFCGLLATGFAVLTILLNWVFTFRLYRARVMKVRQGKYFFDRRRVRLEDASAYPGRQLASCLFGYVLVFSSSYTISFLLWWETVRTVIWQEAGLYIAVALAASAVCYLLTRLAGFFLAPFNTVTNRKLFNLFEFIFLVINFGAGLGIGLLRLIQAFAKFVFGFSRVDLPTFPGQRQLERVDGGYASYLAMLCLDHEQNSPIVSVFMNQVVRELRLRRDEKNKAEAEKFSAPMEAALARAARLNTTRWQIIYTLLNNPRLQPLRKHSMFSHEVAEDE